MLNRSRFPGNSRSGRETRERRTIIITGRGVVGHIGLRCDSGVGGVAERSAATAPAAAAPAQRRRPDAPEVPPPLPFVAVGGGTACAAARDSTAAAAIAASPSVGRIGVAENSRIGLAFAAARAFRLEFPGRRPLLTCATLPSARTSARARLGAAAPRTPCHPLGAWNSEAERARATGPVHRHHLSLSSGRRHIFKRMRHKRRHRRRQTHARRRLARTARSQVYCALALDAAWRKRARAAVQPHTLTLAPRPAAAGSAAGGGS